ncbi:MAG: TetR family transcriptional regulator [Alteromonadaceae bacterium]|nr:TetR family transcriptional regulator [Alteromonadaceae bacterium]
MSKRDQIIKAAEQRAREGGYNNFSFRELAKEIGIKSASVHYYFPTKEDLGVELARQYTEAFLAKLGEPETKEDPIAVYINAFRSALVVDKKMCLCGLFGAESEILPESVQRQTRLFFEANIAWLIKAFKYKENLDEAMAKRKSIQLLALLEGAMILGKSMNSIDIFDCTLE